MKTLFSLLVFLPVFLFSQNVPTPGFEDWYIGNVIQRPQGWITSNIFSVAQFGIYSVEPDSENFVQGNVSCKLTTYQENPDSLPAVAFITNGQPMMDYETMEVDFITGGTPFAYKPTKLLGFYKYTSNSPIEDFAQARVILKKYNQTTGKRDTIGLGENMLLNPSIDFIPFEVPINYLVPNTTPDSIVLIFYSSYPDFPNTGAELWLDSLSFDLSTSIPEVTEVQYFKVSPNPAKDLLNLEIKASESGILHLYNTEGKILFSQNLNSNLQNLQIQVAHLPSAIYFLSLSSENGNPLQTQKIMIE